MKLLVVSALVVVLSVLDKVDSSAYDKIVSHSRIRAKKEGPNVCALQQVSGTKKKYFSTCRNWYQGTICGRKAPVLYECCPGYMKLDGMRGCPAVAPIDHVYGTLDLVGARTTQRYSDSSKLREEIEGPGSYTMFAPSNEAWDLLDPNVRSALEDNVNIELYNALHYHMANKRLLTKDLRNGMKITSMYNDLELIINHYPNGVITVNCARIIHGNQVSTNGVVHVIDRVITSVGNTIQDIIEVDPDLSSLSTAATASGLLDKLGEPGHFTLFAPTDEAFRKLDREVLERIMGNKGALQALLNFHLLDSVLCSEAIMAGASYETLEGHNIEVGCDGESLTINGVKMVLKKDIITSNGVIHLIDQVLMPDSAKQVMELVGASQSMYGDMVSELGLVSLMRPNMEYTLLAPFNAAFSDEVMAMDQDELRVILENHILKKKLVLSQLYNGQRLETISGKWLRVFIYRAAVCIENACMVRGSKEGINGALHLLRTFIKPADSNMFQVLRSSGKFKIFLSLMEAAGLTELLQQEGDYTLFAPTDDAFKGLSQQDIALLKRDVNALRTILLYHISNGIFIGGGLEGGVTNLLKSLQGNNLRVLLSLDDTVGQCSALLPYAFESGLALSVETSISSYCRMSFPTQSRSLQNNTIQVNSIEVSDPDVMASNGVIHYVKTLIYPEDVPVGSQELQTLLRRVVRHIQIKYVPGYRYREIPLTFLKRTVTRVIQDQRPRYRDRTRNRSFRDVSGEPSITKVTRVIEGEPTITKVTRVIEGEPTITKVTRVIEGEPTFTKVTRVIEGDPAITKVTRVIQGGNRRRTRLAPPYRERTH